MAKTIPLRGGYVVTVDDEDYDLVIQHLWHVNKHRGPVYALTKVRTGPGKRKSLAMHRLILNAPDGVSVDHRDGNGLNNVRANLRFATHAENMRNSRPRANKRSRFKGVYYSGTDQWRRNRWVACINVGKKAIHLGRHATEEEAARAYDTAAKTHHKEFARLNFPN